MRRRLGARAAGGRTCWLVKRKGERRLRLVLLRHCLVQEHVLNKAFLGVVGMSSGPFMTLVIVRTFLYTMRLKKPSFEPDCPLLGPLEIVGVRSESVLQYQPKSVRERRQTGGRRRVLLEVTSNCSSGYGGLLSSASSPCPDRRPPPTPASLTVPLPHSVPGHPLLSPVCPQRNLFHHLSSLDPHSAPHTPPPSSTFPAFPFLPH